MALPVYEAVVVANGSVASAVLGVFRRTVVGSTARTGPRSGDAVTVVISGATTEAGAVTPTGALEGPGRRSGAIRRDGSPEAPS